MPTNVSDRLETVAGQTEKAATRRKLRTKRSPTAWMRKLVDAIVEGVAVRTLKDELSRLEARRDDLDRLLSQPRDDRPLVH